MNEKLLWDKVLDNLKNEVPLFQIDTWFQNIYIKSINNKVINMIIPMQVQKNHIRKHYYDLLEEIVNKLTNDKYEIELILEDEIDTQKEQVEIPSNNIDINIDKNISSNLKKEYTFDSFVVGNSNKFAYTAAKSVADRPGDLYNPLFIYGKSGLGKTHLMHAIGNYIKENTNKIVLYVTSDQFITDFLGINKGDNKGNNFNYIDFFKNKYRNIDVLMIDDIQCLEGATKTQQEFFNTFNSLRDNNKQIIISSDRSPDDLKLLEDRLRTRFSWGLTVDVYPPDQNLRISILQKKILADNINIEIGEEVIEYMASNIGNNVRELEGSLIRLVAYSTTMNGNRVTLDIAIEALKDFVYKGISEKETISKIQLKTAEYFKISVDELKSKRRSSSVTFPRQIAMYLCRILTQESFPKIGSEFGKRDHSTVMHSVNKIEQKIKNDKELLNIINKIKEEIK